VNPVTRSLVPRLFARNERLVCLFDGDAGPMALILVGGIFVGSMETAWAGQVTPLGGKKPGRRYDSGSPIRIARGEEMGRFNMGSTVILLFPPGRVDWDSSLRPGMSMRVRQGIGILRGGPGQPAGEQPP